MAWSTREIAELAGTSLRAVRHYHEVGLLAEPERRTNGYKQYGVTHLVRLLRIKRLTDLGFSLTQIAAMGDDQEHPEEALRSLDAELAATIERLQRVRIELGVILRNSTPADLPAELAGAADVPMSDADRQLAIVSTRVLGPTRLRAYADMLASAYETTPSDAEFDEMPADTDEATRQAVAERMLPQLRTLLDKHPELAAPNTDAPRGERHAQETLAKAMRELYNPAQLDTMRRLGELIAAEAEPPAR